ncbi:MAG: ATP-binding cassette domain-containing protein [Chloroflexi bacterium]|nr:ATP-binding cassette domain-containing protein [Chloroflexota bacterium]
MWQRLRREPDRREPGRAVDGIDPRAGTGGILGVLGPNGAGETTTLRMLATLLEPPSGEARVLGLDTQAARDLRERVRDLRRQGRTALLTTRYTEEADQLRDRIAIIDHGRIVALDTPAALKRQFAGPERLEQAMRQPTLGDAFIGLTGHALRERRTSPATCAPSAPRSARSRGGSAATPCSCSDRRPGRSSCRRNACSSAACTPVATSARSRRSPSAPGPRRPPASCSWGSRCACG